MAESICSRFPVIPNRQTPITNRTSILTVFERGAWGIIKGIGAEIVQAQPAELDRAEIVQGQAAELDRAEIVQAQPAELDRIDCRNWITYLK